MYNISRSEKGDGGRGIPDARLYLPNNPLPSLPRFRSTGLVHYSEIKMFLYLDTSLDLEMWYYWYF